MTALIDLSNQTLFGWTILKRAPTPPGTHGAYWLCQCVCGTQRSLPTSRLRNGGSTSCGCLGRIRQSMKVRTHGQTINKAKPPEYKSWDGMKQRTLNPTDKAFPRYGGRGITICERWRESFENFLADMGPRPSPRHSVERRNNDGAYSPENCYWGTYEEQNNNKQDNTSITFRGQTLTVTQWAEVVGIPYQTLHKRLHVAGWPIDRALTEPVHHKKPH